MRSPRSFLFFFLSVFSAPVTSEAQVDVKVSSKWGPWGEWSPCSRTCGVGVSYQERECLEKSKPEIYCKGDKRTHRTCNIQDCPEGSRNFRYEQCEAFNNRTLDGHKYKWVPYVPGHQTCVLNCMPKGKFFFVRWADKVVDGTKCTSESYDICVDGKCKKLGCDLILNSSAKEDKCRVCNGNGENCRTHRGNYTSAGDGYKEIVVIPVSATNIDVREMTPSPHFLALADSSDNYFLNGDYVIARSQKVKIAGAVFQYERTGYGQERLFSLGPTTEPVHVQILLNGNRNARVSYEFSVPKSVTKLPAPTQFSWKTGEFDKCSSSCAGGEQKRRVYCVRDNNGKEVSKSNCNQDEKPSHRRKCNTQPCPASWFISAWSTCSQTCRRGKQVRRVHCNHVIEGGDTAMIPDDQCPDSKPTTMRSCEVEKSCPRWSMGLWSKCSVSCGMGTRRRDVKCNRLGSKTSLPAESCDLDKKPRHVEKCNPGPCTVSWMASDWSECYPSCGKGMSTRMVYCVSISNNDQKYPDDLCDNSSKPISKKECFSDSPCPPMWHGSQWSRCTATCGVGMQMRNVLCAAKEGQDMLRILPNDKCKEEKKMNGVQKCSVRPCQAGWYIYPWQQCSKTCGQGTKRRSVKCFADSKEDPNEKWCIAENKPVMEEQCLTKECEVPTTQPTTPKQTTTASTTKPSSPLTTTTTSAPTTVPATTTERTTTKKTTTRPTVTTARRLKPARITLPPKDIMAYVGTEVLFRCKATGDPKPVISWRKGSIPVSSLDSSRIQILPDGDLRVADIIEDDNDIYTCIATNFVGPMDTKVARLAVIVPVSVVVSPKNTTVRPGKQVTITCTSRGKPTPTVEWYKDGRFLSSRSGLQVTRTTVTISKAQTFDSGKYQCRGSHNYGFASDSMNLRVVKKIEPTDAPVKCNDNPAIAHCEVVRRVRYCCIPYYMKACCKTCEDLLPGCSKRNK